MSQKNPIISRLFVLMILVSGCSTEILINTTTESLPIVYGVIDLWSDSYILYIAKSVQAESDIHQIIEQPGLFKPDSVMVRMELWNDSVMLWFTLFHPVTSDKLPGFFQNGSGLIMKSDRIIPRTTEGDTVDITYPDFRNLRFFVTSPDFSKPAYARVEYSKPVPILQPFFTDQNVRLYGPDPLVINWSVDEYFKYFDLYFQVRYSEMSDSIRNSSVTFCYALDIPLADEKYEVRVEPDRFLNLLATALSRDTLACSHRRIMDFDIIVAGGDKNFENYLVQARFASADYQKPWTNIVNGLGIIALKSESKKNWFRFHSITIDSLALGRYTKQFRFVRW